MAKQSTEAAELSEIRDRLLKEMMIERMELEARIKKIDLQIASLGLQAPDKSGEMAYKFNELLRKWESAK